MQKQLQKLPVNPALPASKFSFKRARCKTRSFFVCPHTEEPFTTKQLERDFGDAAYATIRSFVLKFTNLALLEAQPRSNKVIYQVKKSS